MTPTITDARRDDMEQAGKSNIGRTCWIRTAYGDTALQGVVVRDDRNDVTGKRMVIIRTGEGEAAEYHLADELTYCSLIHAPR